MMRVLSLLWLVFFAVLGSATPASAGLMDVLQQLSGPGPFGHRGGPLPHLALAGPCAHRSGQPVIALGSPGRPDSPSPTSFVQSLTNPCIYVDFTRYIAKPEDHDIKSANYGEVTAESYDFGVSFALLPPFELGFGAGRIHFEANGVETTKFAVTLYRLALRPLLLLPRVQDQWWAGALKFQVRETWITGHLDGSNFGVAKEVFSEDNDLVTAATFVTLDLGDLIGGYLRR